MNKCEDILVKHIEDTETGKSNIEYHLDKYMSTWDKYLSMWDKYLSKCGQLEPPPMITFEMRGGGKQS